jgi:hypothetical protein
MPMEERRADKANREKAEGKIAALKLGDKWAKPTNAGNGRIRLKHESGVTVEGNELSLYAVVMAGKVAGYDFKLQEAIQAVEASAKTVEEPKIESYGSYEAFAAAGGIDKLKPEPVAGGGASETKEPTENSGPPATAPAAAPKKSKKKKGK